MYSLLRKGKFNEHNPFISAQRRPPNIMGMGELSLLNALTLYLNNGIA